MTTDIDRLLGASALIADVIKNTKNIILLDYLEKANRAEAMEWKVLEIEKLSEES